MDAPRQAAASAAEPVQDNANNVKVLIRVRPINAREAALEGHAVSLQQLGASTLRLGVEDRTYSFKFDEVVGRDGTQEEIFQLVGQPVVNNVMQGYNACCFAYGQTGAGKTYTMQGALDAASDGHTNPQRGLAPRVFHAIFQAIEEKEGEMDGVQRQYTCRCSFLQIYKESVSDLLQNGDKALALRYDAKSGVYVENLSEEVVVNMEDALQLMMKGAQNRKVGETKMNRESSRSHSVFTMKVECRTVMDNGLTNVRYGTLHMVDLAGSERIRISGATGSAMHEATEINLSLTTLGRVISKVVEAQRAKVPGRHIPYRDSKLTFLLQDSLGGNAKTMVVANVSASRACAHETLSTLQFAERAKCVRNRAVVNVDMHGDTKALQAEIERLQAELQHLQAGTFEPMMAERDALKVRLQDQDKALASARNQYEVVVEERAQLEYQVKRLDEKLLEKDRELSHYEDSMAKLVQGNAADVQSAQEMHAAAVAEMTLKQKRAIEDCEQLHAEKIAALESGHATEIADTVSRLEAQSAAALADALAAHEAVLEELKQQHEEGLQIERDVTQQAHEAATAELKRQHEATLLAERDSAQQAQNKLQSSADSERKAAAERMKALEQHLASAALERDGVSDALDALRAEHAAAVRGLEDQVEEIKAARDLAVQERESAAKDSEQQSRSAEEQALQALRDHEAALQAVREELDSVRSEAERQHKEICADRDAQIEQWRAKQSAVEKSLEAERAARESERSALVAESGEAASTLEKQLVDMRKQRDALESSMKSLEADLDAERKNSAAEKAVAREVGEAKKAAETKVVELEKQLRDLEEGRRSDAEARLALEASVKAKHADLEAALADTATLSAKLETMRSEAEAQVKELESGLASVRASAKDAASAAELSAAQAAAVHASALAAARDEAHAAEAHHAALEAVAAELRAEVERGRAAEDALRTAHATELAAAAETARAVERELRDCHARELADLSAQMAASSKEATEKASEGLKSKLDEMDARHSELLDRCRAAAEDVAAARAERDALKSQREDDALSVISATEALQEQVEAKEAEIERLRYSLARAEDEINAELQRLEFEREEQEQAYRTLQSEMESQLEETAAQLRVESSRAAAESERLNADREMQRRDYESAIALHQRELQDALQRYEENLAASASRAAAAEAATATERDRLQAAREQASTAAEALAAQKAAYEALQERFSSAEADRNEARTQVATLQASLAEVRAALADAKASESAVNEREADVRDNERHAREALLASTQQNAKLQSQLVDLRTALSTSEASAVALRAQASSAASAREQQAQEWLGKLAVVEDDVRERDARLEQQSRIIDELRAEVDALRDEADHAATGKTELERLLANIQGMINEGNTSRPGSAAGQVAADAALRDTLQRTGVQHGGALRAPGTQTPKRVAGLQSHSIRAQRTPVVGHNEYMSREPGLGKPCLQMDGAMFHERTNAATKALSENASPNAKRGEPRQWRGNA